MADGAETPDKLHCTSTEQSDSVSWFSTNAVNCQNPL
jgi:hypothetical protein